MYADALKLIAAAALTMMFATGAQAADWRPISTQAKGITSVDFHSLRGPPTRRLAWITHSLYERDPVLDYDFLMVLIAVDCDEETTAQLSAVHYTADGTSRFSDDNHDQPKHAGPNSTMWWVVQAVCAPAPPETDQYPDAISLLTGAGRIGRGRIEHS